MLTGVEDDNFKKVKSGMAAAHLIEAGLSSQYENLADFKLSIQWNIYEYIFPGSISSGLTNVDIFEQFIFINLGVGFQF